MNLITDNLEAASNVASDGLGEILSTYYDNSTVSVSPYPEFSIRELRGLDKAMQTMRGELINNTAKLSEIDKHLTYEKTKLEQAGDEFSRRRVAERLRNLEDERLARLEAASSNREALCSQISRIRETINRVLIDDTTLADKN